MGAPSATVQGVSLTNFTWNELQDLEYEWKVLEKTYEIALVKTASHGLGMKIKMRQGEVWFGGHHRE